MIAIDWVAMGVLAGAWGFSMVKSVPQSIRHWVFALACFGIAGYRFSQGGTRGPNLIFVVIAAAIGLQYAVRALRTPRQQ